MVDNPAGKNGGFYTTVDLDQDPKIYGKWEVLPFHSGVLAVHAALLPGGDVLFFAGSGSSQVRAHSPDFGNVAKGVPISVVWTPSGNTFFHPDTPRTADGKPFDVFCGGDAFLPDGRMLSAGGTKSYNPFTGRADAIIFDPKTRQWSFTAHMAHGRWYPTLMTLGDGRMLATTGLDAQGGEGSKNSMEIYCARHGDMADAAFRAWCRAAALRAPVPDGGRPDLLLRRAHGRSHECPALHLRRDA